MTFTEPTRCALCGNANRYQLRPSLVKWADAPAGMSYAHVDRCQDEAACRSRVYAEGESWPLAERKEAKVST